MRIKSVHIAWSYTIHEALHSRIHMPQTIASFLGEDDKAKQGGYTNTNIYYKTGRILQT